MTRTNPTVGTADVKAVYDGVQARLYELFMGQQIHVGGLRSSIELADAAGIGSGQRGVSRVAPDRNRSCLNKYHIN